MEGQQEEQTSSIELIRSAIKGYGVSITYLDRDALPKRNTRPICLLGNKTHGPCDDLVILDTFSEAGFDPIQIFYNELPQSFRENTMIREARVKEINFLSGKQFREQGTAEFRNVIQMGKTPSLILEMRDVFLGFSRDDRLSRSLVEVIRSLQIDIQPVFLKYDSQNRTYIVRTGPGISADVMKKFKTGKLLLKYIQSSIFALGSPLKINRFYFNEKDRETQEEIQPPIETELLEQNIRDLKFHHLVSSRGRFDVFIARTQEIPYIILEIGRLREITFREVGEGTGKSRDLDEYDLYYNQLFIWDKTAKKIVGGYRLGKGSEIYHRYGKEGFYITSMFQIRRGFIDLMKQSVELGRSFVIKEYQKQPLPLFLLWGGILQFILANPEIKYVYGPVSISKFYSDVSKSLIVAFVKKYLYDQKLARYIRPKKPFDPQIEQVDISMLVEPLEGNLKLLDDLIGTIEPDHIKIPILLKQYVRQNARFISFNIDPNFSDALDGLMILDLQKVPYETIEALQKENRQ